MKNATGFKWAVIAAAAIIILVVDQSCNNESKETKLETAGTDSAALAFEKGRYLALYVSSCLDCHSQRNFNQFAGPIIPGTEGMGGEVFDEKFGIPGVVYARNITPDTTYGIGSWTDDEIAIAITKGINKHGDTLFPIMPYAHYNTMSREDIYSIIAYIRTLKPSSEKNKERKLFIPMSAAYPPLQSNDLASNQKPPVSEMLQYGGYMVNAAACMDCHTQMEKGRFVMDKMFAGGFAFDMDKFKVVSANITPDSITGIGKWTEAMFIEKFKSYKDPVNIRTDPGKNNSIMPWSLYAQLNEFDLKAIYRYLRTLPAKDNLVVKHP